MNERKTQLHFVVNDKEEALIEEKMKTAGFKNISQYLRKMAIDGYTINLDLSDMKEALRLLRIMSNNLNQYAKKANESGSIYLTDIEDLKRRHEEIFNVMKEVLSQLSAL